MSHKFIFPILWIFLWIRGWIKMTFAELKSTCTNSNGRFRFPRNLISNFYLGGGVLFTLSFFNYYTIHCLFNLFQKLTEHTVDAMPLALIALGGVFILILNGVAGLSLRAFLFQSKKMIRQIKSNQLDILSQSMQWVTAEKEKSQLNLNVPMSRDGPQVFKKGRL